MENNNITSQSNFHSNWILWYHHIKDNWKIDGYRELYKITNIEDYWILYNNWDKLGGINNKHFFLMRDGILPLWEDKENANGGCWSFKKNENEANDIWNELSLFLVGETLSQDKELINGISICLKKGKKSVIKIWNNDKSKSDIKFINKKILEKWGTDIIYIENK